MSWSFCSRLSYALHAIIVQKFEIVRLRVFFVGSILVLKVGLEIKKLKTGEFGELVTT